MKIGFYGGIANNTYVYAKAFSRKGLEVCFIRDRRDIYPFSQPVWEDIRWTCGYNELSQPIQWAEKEKELGWEPPAWLYDPLSESQPLNAVIGGIFSPLDIAFFNELARGQTHWGAVVSQMKQYDINMVCGIEGEILALASGRPFVIIPHGGDIRTVAGYHPPSSQRFYVWKIYWMQLHLLRRAFKRALWIGVHDPKGIGGHIGGKTQKFNLKYCPIPYHARERLPKVVRHSLLAQLMYELQLPVPRAETVIFIPSRMDFFWKGTDRFLRAFARSAQGARMHLVVSGWGKDYEQAKEMIPPGMATFLPCAVSKPILYDLFRAADLVVDQFLLGTYGTSAVEAMSCGTPVMMWIENKAFAARGWEAPPVLNVQDEQQIKNSLDEIRLGGIDLEARGREAHDWFNRTHDEEVAVPRLVEQFRSALNKE